VEGLYSWLLAAIGLHGAKISSFTAVAIAGVNVGLNFIVIPKYGISGAILCLIISYTVSIFLKLWIGGDYLKKGIDEDIKSEENINT
jgi:O-antigen/teichoic acid export membrane protein